MVNSGPGAVVHITLMGSFAVVVDGRTVRSSDFARRDATQLVKLLALRQGHRLHQEQVFDILWPETDLVGAANRLHKAAHYARRALGDHQAVVLTHRMVELFPTSDIVVDAEEFDRLAASALTTGSGRSVSGTPRHAVAEAISAYGGPLLPDDPYEPLALRERERLSLRHRELLRTAERFDEMLALDPTDEEAHLGVMVRLLQAGDRNGVLAQFDSLRRTLEFELGVGPSDEAVKLRRKALALASPGTPRPAGAVLAPRFADLATQTVRFCTASDGVRLAYATSGEGPTLVKVANWLTHLDYDWGSPVWNHWWRGLSANNRLVRYDERGSGLSDWNVPGTSYSLDAWVRDLEAVVDTLGLERFPLFGMSQGGPIAISYAARHPERVSHLIVYGTCARALWARASTERRRELQALGELIRLSWGRAEPGFMQVYDAKFLPDGPLEAWRAFDELQRKSTSPRNAWRLWRAFGSLDAAEAARTLDVPTLILHASDDQVWSIAEAEELHAMVAGSRLVRLDSRNHILRANEPAFAELLDSISGFLAEPA